MVTKAGASQGVALSGQDLSDPFTKTGNVQMKAAAVKHCTPNDLDFGQDVHSHSVVGKSLRNWYPTCGTNVKRHATCI